MYPIPPVITSVSYKKDEVLKDEFFLTQDSVARRNFIEQIRDQTGDLSVIQMDKLSDVVVLAGPNGSGKSRTLRLVRRVVQGVWEQWPQPQKKRQDADSALRPSVRFSAGARPVAADIMSTPPAIIAPSGATRGTLKEMSRKMDLDAGNYAENMNHAAEMAQACFDEHWGATHQDSKLEASRRHFLTERWHRLSKLIEDLLKKPVDVDEERNVRVGGVVLDIAVNRFSEGERRLFGLASSLVGNDNAEIRRVIFCDEPENHLHPEAAITVLKSVQRALPTAQIWIATHSITVIAAMGWENVWVADSGKVSFGGRDTGRIVTSLLGGADNIARLRAFMDEPDKAAAAKFATECLLPPTTAPYVQKDPQIEMAISTVATSPSSRPTSVLDWGAGHGRLPYWIRGQAVEVRNALDYYALNPDLKSSAACLEQIRGLYDNPEQRMFLRAEGAINHANVVGGFDFIVLANVLHEIDIAEWPALFNDMNAALGTSGHLLILEDGGMRVGELPTHEGFLLLSHVAAQLLFDGKDVSELPCSDPKYRDRLRCFQVPKIALGRATPDSVRTAIEEIQRHSLREIAQIRESGVSGYDAGNRHALHLALHANASLALQKIAQQEPALS